MRAAFRACPLNNKVIRTGFSEGLRSFNARMATEAGALDLMFVTQDYFEKASR